MIAGLEEFTLVVLGPKWSGKSAFVQAVLDLDDSFMSPFPAKRASIDNFAFLLRFIEVSLDDMRVSSKCSIEWPTYVQQTKSRVDGAFFLWDATKRAPQQDDISDTLSKYEEGAFHMNLVFEWSRGAQSSNTCHERLNCFFLQNFFSKPKFRQYWLLRIVTFQEVAGQLTTMSSNVIVVLAILWGFSDPRLIIQRNVKITSPPSYEALTQ